MAELDSIEDKYQNRFNRTIADTLSGDQTAQTNCTPDNNQARHRISVKTDKADIRLYLGRYYLVIMFGKEMRGEERLDQDRKMHPLLTRANIRAIFFAWLLVFSIALLAQGALH